MISRKELRRFAVIVVASSLLAACSGGGGSSGSPKPTASPAIDSPAVDSAVELSRLALGALQADATFGLFLAPNHLSPLLNPTSTFAAVCDATSATAQSVTAELNATVLVVRTAIYPPGDTLCSMAPEFISVIGYPAASGTYPRVGNGYIVNYSLSALTANAVFNGGVGNGGASNIYVTYQDAATVDFATNFVSVGSLTTLPSQPMPGSFPATFPSTFADASTAISAAINSTGLGLLSFFANQYAAITGGAALGAGWRPFFGNLSQSSATGNTYALADGGMLAFTPTAGGAASLTERAGMPSFAISRIASDPAIGISTFPLGAEQTRFVVGTKVSLGQHSTQANFTTGPVNGATVLSDGTLASAHVHYMDAVSKVSADIATTDGVALNLSIEDLMTNAALTVPATIPFVGAGSGVPCTYAYAPFAFPSGPRYTDTITNYYCPSIQPSPGPAPT